MSPEEWPPEFGGDLNRSDLIGLQHGFAFDKSLEVLARHPAIWPILMELTNSPTCAVTISKTARSAPPT